MHAFGSFGIVRVAAAAALLGFFGTAALAAPSPFAGVDVQSAPRGHDVSGQTTANGQVTGRTLFQKEVALTCTGTSGLLCLSQIYKVPDKHRLELSKVTCFVTYEDGDVTLAALLVNGFNFVIPFGSTWTTFSTTPTPENIYTFETDAPAFVTAGQIIAGVVQGVSSGGSPKAYATCAIFGTLVTLK